MAFLFSFFCYSHLLEKISLMLILLNSNAKLNLRYALLGGIKAFQISVTALTGEWTRIATRLLNIYIFGFQTPECCAKYKRKSGP